MQQFSLDIWFQDKSRKVVTRDGRPVRIVCWDRKYEDYTYPILALVDWGNVEEVVATASDGRAYMSNGVKNSNDLFFADEEKELTEFEKELKYWIGQSLCNYENNGCVSDNMSDSVNIYLKAASKKLLELARKELEEGEQKSADEVKPKFKNGQWIVWQDKCYKVNYNGCGYELVDQNGLSTSLEYGTIDENAHLWDIAKDAKEGDVLYTSSTASHETFIFRCIQCDDTIGCHCSYDSEDGFVLGIYHFIGSVKDKYVPATKEQRDLLFQKMKEKGYELDAEKKELRKIEQKPTVKIEQFVWSEEDGKTIDEAISLINMLASGYGEKVTEPITFNGVKMINNVKERLRNLHQKPNHWKPSEKQMDDLYWASILRPSLKTLYEQLKTL